jgi:fatty acid-binding protein DegV
MRIGLAVDASCDLPDVFLEKHGIRVLPAILQLGNRTWVDDRAPEATMKLYRQYIADRALDARSGACSAAEIREIFLQELVLDYDRVLVISAGTDFSDMFANATEASYAILQSYRERRSGGRQGSFALRVLDSGSICAGSAVAVCRALELLAADHAAFEKMRRALREEVGRLNCLIVPGDPWYLRRRGLDGRGGGLGLGDYALAAAAGARPVIELNGGRRRVVARSPGFDTACSLALRRATEAVRKGLACQAVVLSFGGDPRVIREMPSYHELEAALTSARMALQFSVMSAAMGARVGPGALSVGWLADG